MRGHFEHVGCRSASLLSADDLESVISVRTHIGIRAGGKDRCCWRGIVRVGGIAGGCVSRIRGQTVCGGICGVRGMVDGPIVRAGTVLHDDHLGNRTASKRPWLLTLVRSLSRTSSRLEVEANDRLRRAVTGVGLRVEIVIGLRLRSSRHLISTRVGANGAPPRLTSDKWHPSGRPNSYALGRRMGYAPWLLKTVKPYLGAASLASRGQESGPLWALAPSWRNTAIWRPFP